MLKCILYITTIYGRLKVIALDLIFNISGTNGDIEINLTPEAAKDLFDSSGSIVFPFYNDKFIMTFHSTRKSWEFPAGRREEGESPLECALRESFEETGAILENVIPLGYYVVRAKEGIKKTAIFMSDVERFEPKPSWSETDLVKLFDEIPDNISYEDDVYKIVMRHIEKLKKKEMM